MQSRVAVLPVALALLCSCELIDGWPIIPPQGGPGPGPAPSGDELVIENGSLAGFTVYEPQEKQNDPRAGTPSYVYLENGREAVRLAGNPIDESAPSLFFLDRATITTTKAGMSVRINDRLSYLVEISDFEGEVSLAKVTLRRLVLAPGRAYIESSFIFAARGEGLGGGVAHDLTIRYQVAGVDVGNRTKAISIEAR